MLGGAGRTPSLQRHIGTEGQERPKPASGSSEAREMPESTKPSSPMFFKKQDLLREMDEGGGGPVTSKSSSKSSGDSPPNPTCFSPEPGSSLAGSPSSPHGPGALEGAGPWAFAAPPAQLGAGPPSLGQLLARGKCQEQDAASVHEAPWPWLLACGVGPV